MILSQLRLINFATFEYQEVNFSASFNAIIGETGSGKSLILDALELVLGQRADKKLVRKNCKFATIEAIFFTEDPSIKKYFDDLGHPFEGNEILIKRIIYSNGITKSYINHQTCNLSMIKKFSTKYIDLVGQFENQKLLTSNYQLLLLDTFANNTNLKLSFDNKYQELKSTNKDLLSLNNRSSDKNQRKDFLDYQINELNKLNLCIEEEKELIDKFQNFQNVQKLEDSIKKTVDLISDGEINILDLLRKCKSEVSKLIDSDEILTNLNSADSIIQDVSFKLSKLVSEDFNAQEFDYVASRLDDYQRLKRKYNCETKELVDQLKNFIMEKEELENLDKRINLLLEKIECLKNTSYQIALELHETREVFSKHLSEKLTAFIRNLNMADATIKIELKKIDDLNENGCSELFFLAETNLGEGFYPIKDIASGGELSRILLSVRQILSNSDSVSVFLFDEIDTGMGGETALCIGNALKEVSANSQVIAITHLPQIAINADKLIVVSKQKIESSNEVRTRSTIDEITGKQMKKHVEQMTPLNQ